MFMCMFIHNTWAALKLGQRRVNVQIHIDLSPKNKPLEFVGPNGKFLLTPPRLRELCERGGRKKYKRQKMGTNTVQCCLLGYDMAIKH